MELNPAALFKYGIGLEDVRAALAAANANSPKGAIEDDDLHWQIYSNDQARTAAEYRPLIVAYRNGAAVRLSDVATSQDSVEDLRNLGLSRDQPAVLVQISRQPRRQHHRHRGPGAGAAAAAAGLDPGGGRARRRGRPQRHDPRLAARRRSARSCSR